MTVTSAIPAEVRERNKVVATTIIKQMGGSGRLKAMVGANNFAVCHDDEGGVLFKFKVSRKANLVKVVLQANDTYNMIFYRMGKKEKVVREVQEVYCDMLKPLFEETTGLYLTF